MRNIISLLLIILLLTSSCASSTYMVVDNNTELIRPYGWLNKKASKRDDIIYELSPGSIILGILFYPTIWVPVWMSGWKLYKPVSVKTDTLPSEK